MVSWEDVRLAELLKHTIHMERQLDEAKEAEAERAAEEERKMVTEERLAAVKREKARAKSDKELQLAIVEAITKIVREQRQK